jgi:hypothetical protein
MPRRIKMNTLWIYTAYIELKSHPVKIYRLFGKFGYKVESFDYPAEIFWHWESVEDYMNILKMKFVWDDAKKPIKKGSAIGFDAESLND